MTYEFIKQLSILKSVINYIDMTNIDMSNFPSTVFIFYCSKQLSI